MDIKIGKVFVSYSHRDMRWAQRLFPQSVRTTRGLALQSIDFDRLEIGDEFDQILQREIGDAAGFVFLVSNTFLKSPYVLQKEWQWIKQHENARICCIEIGRALTRKDSENDLLTRLKQLHRDTNVRLPIDIPRAQEDLDVLIARVHRLVARTLDPEGMRVVDRLDQRGLRDVEFLAHGKLADVYVASTATFRRKLAIKVPRENRTEEFLSALDSAGKLSQIPNVVGVYETDTETQPFYCITEFIEGRTLARLIDDAQKNHNRIEISLVRNVMLKLSLALRTAHTAGICHLNIRPANILVDSHGEPYLLPMGRAREAPHKEWSRDKLAAEPVAFNNAPPEFFGDRGWSEQSADIYALGVVAYLMITGRVADLVANRKEMQADPSLQPVFREPEDLTELNPECPVALARIVERALHPNPAHRYRTFEELCDSFMRYPDANLAIAELSWRRCLNSEGQDIFVRFYERFFADAKSAERLFTKPWPTERQKNLLRDAVINLFHYYALKQTYHDIPVALNPLEGLAQQHLGLDIENSHFQAFSNALVDTVMEIDPHTGNETGDDNAMRRAWEAVVQPGTDYMRQRVAELSSG